MLKQQHQLTLEDISKFTLIDEKTHVSNLLHYCEEHKILLGLDIRNKAMDYIRSIHKSKVNVVDSFMSEYNLSTYEGVSIMCLAEALLRIPDDETAYAIIHDKIKAKDWSKHLSKLNPLILNASTRLLSMTDKLLNFGESRDIIGKTVGKLSDPLIFGALKKAIEVISNRFILAPTIKTAMSASKKFLDQGYSFSYDILGESSRDSEQAAKYHVEYIEGIGLIGKYNPNKDLHVAKTEIDRRQSISVKLTALYPRFEYSKKEKLEETLIPVLIDLIDKCEENNIILSLDAEEAKRLDLYLYVVTRIFELKKFKDVSSIGLVVQSYQKRAFYIIDYINQLAKKYKCIIPVRLVKGAYWDSEIQAAQELGLEGYPVFTYKHFTDLSYTVCAFKMLQMEGAIYSQFATHNAYTAATITNFAHHKNFEFQRLFGMGEVLHANLIKEGYKSRIYAPIGRTEILLPYLMRRLLENGANTSFVFMVKKDDKENGSELVENLISRSKKTLEEIDNDGYAIPVPKDIFGKDRENSLGYEISIAAHYHELQNEIAKFNDKKYEGYSIIDGKIYQSKNHSENVNSPVDQNIVGASNDIGPKEAVHAIETAADYFDEWSLTSVEYRAEILRKFAQLLNMHRYQIYSLLIRKSGKSVMDAISEVREAIDFARYYANMAVSLMSKGILMPGCTGEENKLSWHARGVFVCISPWNFPLSIFCGQILAALVTGNTVVSKPSELSPFIATFAAELMYEAGVPKKALHLVIGKGSVIGDPMMSNDNVAGICFTGSTGVALHINQKLAQRKAPIASVIAETGGQNCMIVDSSALLEQTTDYILKSAFDSTGQRCSALRVLYIQKEVYEPLVKMISLAMQELDIGPTIDFVNDIGPAINAKAVGELMEHVNDMRKKGCNVIEHKKAKIFEDKKESAFIAPYIIEINNINDLAKENFGPILHVISFDISDLDKVIKQINDYGYGLTFGIQSRIQSRIDHIASHIKAGNIYVNRTTIGAQVESQPFGGERNSGTGFKAGGPHYMFKFMTERIVTTNIAAFGGNVALIRKSPH